MTGKGLETRVGLVVVLAVLAAVIGTMWFQKFQLAEKRYRFFVTFTDVGGLLAGDPIFVNGVEGGRVNDIALLDRKVVVEMGVRQGVSIPRDSRISLQAVGFMGERQVTIIRGSATNTIAPGDTVSGELLMGLGEVMGQTGDLMDDVKATVRNLRELTDAINKDGKLREGIADFAATGKDIRGMTEENRTRFNRSLENLDQSTTQLTQLLNKHYADLDTALTAVGEAGRQMQTTVDHLNEISDNLKEISGNLRAGKGTAGRLVTDDTLILRMESATASLDSLLKDMREHPNRYVKFSLF
ncbi:MAG TPA: MlaD family protein [Candidatus Krumholzibacteria bacterium]|nr:MlaD family protein [Candidatus Krumholzibacteria bacterium]